MEPLNAGSRAGSSDRATAPIKIPAPGYRARAGNAWPTHRGKARAKASTRRRMIADLAKEQLAREKTSGVRV